MHIRHIKESFEIPAGVSQSGWSARKAFYYATDVAGDGANQHIMNSMQTRMNEVTKLYDQHLRILAQELVHLACGLCVRIVSDGLHQH